MIYFSRFSLEEVVVSNGTACHLANVKISEGNSK